MHERSGDRGKAVGTIAALLPHLLYAALVVATWRRWAIPFQDHGRELETGWRLLRGEVLYRDVGWYFGPLPAYLDALGLRLFGVHADVLVAMRTLAGLLGVEALRRLGTRLSGSPLAGAATAAVAVATCAFGVSGAWPFPYCVAALYGSVASWWAVETALSSEGAGRSYGAAVLAGLAAGTKLELAPAALAGVALTLLSRRPRREAVGALAVGGALAAAAWGLPVLLFGLSTVVDHGYLIALRAPREWEYGHSALFWGGMTPATFLRGGGAAALLPSVAVLGGALLVAWSLGRRSPGLAGGVLAALGAASALLPARAALHALLPASILLVAAAGVSWLKGRREVAVTTLAVGAVMAPALARQPFLLRFEGYLGFTGPLAVVLALSVLVRWLGEGRAGPAAAQAFTLFCAGAALGHGAERAVTWRRHAVLPVETSTVRFLQPVDEARCLNEALEALRTRVPPGAPVVVLPEPGFLLFASGHPGLFVDTQFYPGCQTPAAEARMVATIRAHPPAAILEFEREYSEFGPDRPRKGLLDAFYREVDATTSEAAVFGKGTLFPGFPGRHVVTGRLLLPRPPSAAAGAPGLP